MAPTQVKPRKTPAVSAAKSTSTPKRTANKRHTSDNEILESIEYETDSSADTKQSSTGWFGRTSVRIAAIVTLLIVLLILKSGEDDYLTAMSSTQTTDADPYEQLGILRTASRSEVRQAYRKLSLEWHPDRREDGCDDECKLRFRRISESYKLLMDSASRKLYDETMKVTGGSTRAFYNQLAPTEYMLTEPVWQNIVTPSLEGRQLWTSRDISGVWVFLVADPKAEWTEHLIPLWTDLATKYHGRVSFARVDETNEAVAQLLPVKLAITPAIMILRPNDVPIVYDKMLHFQPRHLVQWLNDNIPDVFRLWKGTAQKLRNFLETEQMSADGRLPILIYSAKDMAGLYKSVALRTRSTIDWIRVDDFQLFREAFADALPDRAGRDASKKFLIAPAGVAGAMEDKKPLKVLPVSSHAWHLDKVNLRQREDSDDDDESKFMYEQLMDDIERIIHDNEVPLFDDNLPLLCPPGNSNERVVCSIRVDPATPLTADEIAERQVAANDAQLQADEGIDLEEAAVDVEEYEDSEYPQAHTARRRAQLCRLHTGGIKASGSAVARTALEQPSRARAGEPLLVDTSAAAYKWMKEPGWKRLPASCQAVMGRTVKRLRFRWLWSGEPADCAPRSRLGYRATVRYWCSLHWIATSFIFGAPALALAIWPRSASCSTFGAAHDKEE